MDEADNGLSLHNQAHFKFTINKMINRWNVDIIIITHNPFLIIDSDKVYSFEHRKFIVSDTYIKVVTNYKIEKYGEITDNG